MLLGTYVEMALKRAGVGRLARGPVWLLNRARQAASTLRSELLRSHARAP